MSVSPVVISPSSFQLFPPSSVSLSPCFSFVGCVFSCGRFILFDLKRRLNSSLDSVISFHFVDESRFVALFSSGEFVLFSFENSSLVSLRRLCDLFDFVSDVKKTRFFGSNDGFVYFLLDDSVVFRAWTRHDESSPIVTRLFDAKKFVSTDSSIEDIELIFPLLFILTENSIYAIDAETQQLIHVIQLEKYLRRFSSTFDLFKKLSVATDFSAIVISSSENILSILDVPSLLPHESTVESPSGSELNFSIDTNLSDLTISGKLYKVTPDEDHGSIWKNIIQKMEYEKCDQVQTMEEDSNDSFWFFEALDEWKIREVEIDTNFVSVWLERDKTTPTKLLILERITGKEVGNLSVPAQDFVLFGAKHQLPTLILSPEVISVVVYLPEQELLINKVMVYCDASLADKIFEMNEWRANQLSLSILEWALRNHRLDLVFLFFKSHNVALLEQFSPLMELIFSFVRQSFADRNSKIFAEKILKFILKHLINFLDDFSSADSTSDETFNLQNKIMIYLKTARELLNAPKLEREEEKEERNVEQQNSEQYSNEDFTLDDFQVSLNAAILDRRIPEFQRFWTEKLGMNVFGKILATTTKIVMEFVEKRDAESAKRILINAGINVDNHFRMICEETQQRSLRNFMMKHLKEDEKWLTDVKKLLQIEEFYRSESFDACVNKLSSNSNLEEKSVKKLLAFKFPVISEEEEEISLFKAEKIFSEEGKAEENAYSNLKLSWIKKLDEQQLKMIFYEGNCIYQEQNTQTDLLTFWRWKISYDYSDFERISIPPSSIENIPCISATKHAMLNYLARKGYFCESESICKEIVLKRAASARCLTCPFSEDVLSVLFEFSSSRIITMLYELIFNSKCSFINSVYPLIRLVVWFQKWSQNPNDMDFLFETCLENARLGSDSDSKDAENALTVKYPLAVFCLPHNLGKRLTSKCEFPARLSSLLSDSSSDQNIRDVSIYELLPKSFQRVYRSVNRNISHKDLSYTSPFSSKINYRHEINLDFRHYLKQGRPCYAFAHFLLQEASRNPNGDCDRRRVKLSCAMASDLALSKSNSPSVVTSCIAFMEMLNKSSAFLRLNLHAARWINMDASGLQPGSTSSDSIQGLVSCLENALNSSSFSQVEGSFSSSFINQLIRWTMFKNLVDANEKKYPLRINVDITMPYSWLLLIILAQHCGLSSRKLMKLLNQLTDETIKEHLRTAFSQVEMEKRHKLKTKWHRDSRSNLYRKIGVTEQRQNREPQTVMSEKKEPDESSSEDDIDEEEMSISSMLNSGSSSDSDLFTVLVSCQEIDPATRLLSQVDICSNPAFAVLSTCFGGSTNQSLMTWLSSVSDAFPKCDDFSTYTSLDSFINSPTSADVLLQGFSLFDPSNILVHFIQFLDNLFNENLSDLALYHLSLFLRNPDIIKPEICHSAWSLIRNVLVSCTSPFRLIQFMKILHSINFFSILPRPVNSVSLDFSLLARIQELLLTTQIRLPYGEIADSTSDVELKNIWQRILKELTNNGFGEIALTVSELLCVPSGGSVIVNLVERSCNLSSTRKWSVDANFRQRFWLHCRQVCDKNSVEFEDAVMFFKDCVEKAESHSEKYFLLRLAIKGTKMNNKKSFELEKEMWLERVKAHEQIEFVNSDCALFLSATEEKLSFLGTKADILKTIKCPTTDTQTLFGEAEITAIEQIINQELDEHNIIDACRIAAIFKHETRDLKIILTCMDLAERILTADNVDLSEFQIEFVSGENAVVDLLEKLNRKCKHGRHYTNLVLTYFKAAKLLSLDYNYFIASKNSKDILSSVGQLIKAKSSEGLFLAKQILAEKRVSDKEMVQFVCHQFLTHLTESVNTSIAENSARALHFKEMLTFVSDPSSVGNLLLKKSDEDQNKKTLQLRVELIIWAHFCFSSACDTEGIATVLNMAQQISTEMEAKDSKYLINLLTGIGRYNEMFYVFDLLTEFRSFELLLSGKGMNFHYKIALLDYFWRFQNRDLEKYKMVAMHFCLYREIGDVTVLKADHHLNQAINQGLKSSRAELNQAYYDLAEAAESYQKAACYRLSQSCTHRAQLVALQIYLLPQEKRVIRLSPEELYEFIAKHPVFSEAYLVSLAYADDVKIEWSEAVFNHVIVSGDTDYLTQFHNCLEVTEGLVDKLVIRLRKEKSWSDSWSKRICEVIALIEDAYTEYRLYRLLDLDVNAFWTSPEQYCSLVCDYDMREIRETT